MRAKFFVNFPVLSFGEQMQIDVAHDPIKSHSSLIVDEVGCRSADRWRIFVIPSGVEESLILEKGGFSILPGQKW
jgi:hypothetical protein